MPVIAPTNMAGAIRAPAVETTLNGTDTLVYLQGNGQLLVLQNPTGASITPTISSNGPTTTRVEGIGNVSTASYAVGAIAAGASVMIQLDSIKLFLQGTTVTIGTGTGLVATLYNF